MTQQQKTDLPFGGADAVLSGYQSVADMYGHFVRGLVDVNAESYRFVATRLEDDFQWPATLAQCRNPAEFLEVHGRFLEKMFADYMEEGRRMLDLAGETARSGAHDVDEAVSLGAHAVEEAALAGARMADAVESETERSVAQAAGSVPGSTRKAVKVGAKGRARSSAT